MNIQTHRNSTQKALNLGAYFHVSWTTAPVKVKSWEPDDVVARIDDHMKQRFGLIGMCVHPHVFAGVADVDLRCYLTLLQILI